MEFVVVIVVVLSSNPAIFQEELSIWYYQINIRFIYFKQCFKESLFSFSEERLIHTVLKK